MKVGFLLVLSDLANNKLKDTANEIPVTGAPDEGEMCEKQCACCSTASGKSFKSSCPAFYWQTPHLLACN